MASKKRKVSTKGDEASAKRPSKKAKKEESEKKVVVPAPEPSWLSTDLHDVTFIVRDVAKGTGWRLDVDYTYGGKSSLFGGKGEIEVKESSSTVAVSTCLCLKPGRKYILQIASKEALGHREEFESDSDNDGCAHPLIPDRVVIDDTEPFTAPNLEDGGDEFSRGLCLKTKAGAPVRLAFVRWNTERPQIYLVHCELNAPAAAAGDKEEKKGPAATGSGKEEKKKAPATNSGGKLYVGLTKAIPPPLKTYNEALVTFDVSDAAQLAEEFCVTCDGGCCWCLMEQDLRGVMGLLCTTAVFTASSVADMEKHIKTAHVCPNKGCTEIGFPVVMPMHAVVCKFKPSS